MDNIPTTGAYNPENTPMDLFAGAQASSTPEFSIAGAQPPSNELWLPTMQLPGIPAPAIYPPTFQAATIPPSSNVVEVPFEGQAPSYENQGIISPNQFMNPPKEVSYLPDGMEDFFPSMGQLQR